MARDLCEEFCESIDYIISKKTNSIQYTSTKTGNVVEKISKQQYRISIESGKINRIAFSLGNDTYELNDSVVVLFPNNNLNTETIYILRKIEQNVDDAPIDTSLNSIDIIRLINISTENPPSLSCYILEKEGEYKFQNGYLLPSFTTEVKHDSYIHSLYDYLGISIDVQTSAGCNQARTAEIIQGNYGVRLNCIFTNNHVELQTQFKEFLQSAQLYCKLYREFIPYDTSFEIDNLNGEAYNSNIIENDNNSLDNDFIEYINKTYAANISLNSFLTYDIDALYESLNINKQNIEGLVNNYQIIQDLDYLRTLQKNYTNNIKTKEKYDNIQRLNVIYNDTITKLKKVLQSFNDSNNKDFLFKLLYPKDEAPFFIKQWCKNYLINDNLLIPNRQCLLKTIVNNQKIIASIDKIYNPEKSYYKKNTNGSYSLISQELKNVEENPSEKNWYELIPYYIKAKEYNSQFNISEEYYERHNNYYMVSQHFSEEWWKKSREKNKNLYYKKETYIHPIQKIKNQNYYIEKITLASCKYSSAIREEIDNGNDIYYIISNNNISDDEKLTYLRTNDSLSLVKYNVEQKIGVYYNQNKQQINSVNSNTIAYEQNNNFYYRTLDTYMDGNKNYYYYDTTSSQYNILNDNIKASYGFVNNQLISMGSITLYEKVDFYFPILDENEIIGYYNNICQKFKQITLADIALNNNDTIYYIIKREYIPLSSYITIKGNLLETIQNLEFNDYFKRYFFIANQNNYTLITNYKDLIKNQVYLKTSTFEKVENPLINNFNDNKYYILNSKNLLEENNGYVLYKLLTSNFILNDHNINVDFMQLFLSFIDAFGKTETSIENSIVFDFNNNKMIGDPYNFIDGKYKQEFFFPIRLYGKLTNINIEPYVSPNTFEVKQWDVEGKINSFKISINNIKLYLGNKKEEEDLTKTEQIDQTVNNLINLPEGKEEEL